MAQVLTPLECVVYLIAPLKDLHKIVDQHQKSVYNWRNASGWRRAGQIPPPAQAKLLCHAEAVGLPLTARHLILGAPRDEIAALCRELGRPVPPPAMQPAAPQPGPQGVAAE